MSSKLEKNQGQNQENREKIKEDQGNQNDEKWWDFENEKERRNEELRLRETMDPKQQYDLTCGLKLQAFFECNSPRGQIWNVYRFGAPLSCAEPFKDLLFCWQMKVKPYEEAMKLYEERRKEKMKRHQETQPIWQMREHPPPNFPPSPSASKLPEIEEVVS